jgi:arylsulfatase A-like enzyme
VPFLVRGPGVVTGTDARLTSNIDLAPTFLEWARVPQPANFFDGKSLAASARDAAGSGPTGVLLLGCRTGTSEAAGGSRCGGYPAYMGMPWGLRTSQYKYVEYASGYKQLFDLSTDPYELRNLAPDPAYASTLQSLHNQVVARGGGAIRQP